MLLSDKDIKRGKQENWLDIAPYDEQYLQPASYDVHLHPTLLQPMRPTLIDRVERWVRRLVGAPVYRDWDRADPAAQQQPLTTTTLLTRDEQNRTGDVFWLPPGDVALGATEETVTLFTDAAIAADIAGCSSLGRWWLFVHVTAGFVDPGWQGQLTLELYNASPWHIRLWAGMRIAQIRFYDLSSNVEQSYATTGHYAMSSGPIGSRYVG